jgi:hypothetical protein
MLLETNRSDVVASACHLHMIIIMRTRLTLPAFTFVALVLGLVLGLGPGCDTGANGAAGRRASPDRRANAQASNRGPTPGPTARPAPPPKRGVPVVWNSDSRLTRLTPDQVWVFHQGRRYPLGTTEATNQGFTILSLGDNWTPVLLSEQSPGDAQPIELPYRKRYLDLANDRADRRGHKLRKGKSNYLELYGIPPTPSVLRRRLGNKRLRTCYAKVNREALKAFKSRISAWGLGFAVRKSQGLRKVIDRKLRRKRWKSDEDLRRLKGGKRLLKKLRRAEMRGKAARAALQVLRCEGLLTTRGRRRNKPKGDKVYAALTAYERKHKIVGRGVLTQTMARTMALSPDEADAMALRRVIRERVVHTAGILEDGSANHLAKTYIANGRRIPLSNLVETFTNAALEGLGLTDAATVRAFLFAMPAPVLRDLRVAIRLPAKPAYYSDNMDLEVTINRGDVYYDPPMHAGGEKISQYRGRTPRLTLWVKYHGQRIPLIRWRTTVGGWKDEIRDGQVYLKYKASDVGRRVWRDIIAAPVWIPPPSTPPKEIVRGKKIKTDNMGPGYLSAYGLVAALHLIPRKTRKTPKTPDGIKFWDKGIRTHGSYNYRSVRAGYSHGCHRLYNHKAIRMFSFILNHRHHDRIGLESYPYLHRFEYKGRKYKIKVSNRGYVYRLKELLPVIVTRGRVLGKRKRPIRQYIKKPGVEYLPDAGTDPALSLDGGVPKTTPNPDPTPSTGPKTGPKTQPLRPTAPPTEQPGPHPKPRR